MDTSAELHEKSALAVERRERGITGQGPPYKRQDTPLLPIYLTTDHPPTHFHHTSLVFVSAAHWIPSTQSTYSIMTDPSAASATSSPPPTEASSQVPTWNVAKPETKKEQWMLLALQYAHARRVSKARSIESRSSNSDPGGRRLSDVMEILQSTGATVCLDKAGFPQRVSLKSLEPLLDLTCDGDDTDAGATFMRNLEGTIAKTPVCSDAKVPIGEIWNLRKIDSTFDGKLTTLDGRYPNKSNWDYISQARSLYSVHDFHPDALEPPKVIFELATSFDDIEKAILSSRAKNESGDNRSTARKNARQSRNNQEGRGVRGGEAPEVNMEAENLHTS